MLPKPEKIKVSQNIVSRRDGKVYWIELNRPEKANAISLDMWKALKYEMNKASNDRRVRVIALTGRGRYFSAGEDLKDLKEADTLHSAMNLFLDYVRPVFDQMIKSPKVVITAVNGAAVGAGVELVLASDISFAHQDSYFMLSQGKVGVGPALSLTFSEGIVGKKRLLEMLLTGRRVDANEALNWGMINEIYDTDPSVLVNRYSDEISKTPEMLVRMTKEILAKQLYIIDYNSSFRDIAMFIQSKESRKGIKSFLSPRS